MAKSFKCNQCNKVISSVANLELHANRTGHSDFEESTFEVKPLTESEKQVKILEIKELLATKRKQREKEEEDGNIEREKHRRGTGKIMSKTREEMERIAVKHKAAARKKEKDDAKQERIRIIKEIEKDKLERMSNKGRLGSRLGVAGYDPDGIQYDNKDDDEIETKNDDTTASTSTGKMKKKSNPKDIDECIRKVSSNRAGGDGERCLKMLLLFVGNVCDNPTEMKYRSINTAGKSYIKKVKPFICAKTLLLAVGFDIPEKDGDNKLVLPEDADLQAIGIAREKLKEAIGAI